MTWFSSDGRGSDRSGKQDFDIPPETSSVQFYSHVKGMCVSLAIWWKHWMSLVLSKFAVGYGEDSVACEEQGSSVDPTSIIY